ncbi:signal transduction histidine kinase [Thioflavicoccus mobilis 8321]|uniref:histidine kinase n=1 Tax=Thioflavicoccus mobilis 8321 TaxID=765912 RepID=L0GSC8_9GAMM|nr:HAMP domain-containing sensor histidine kinase [Thioflavicoccus mobilis]AGA89658.1 signal transduction histidine kinase [Thioflavicoccus mobilis 8321]
MPHALRSKRLQRKVLLVIVVIVLLPMLGTGTLSAAWIAGRFEDFIERWIREAAQLERDTLADLHNNARLFADVLAEVTRGRPDLEAGRSPVPPELAPLAEELGISLVQVYDPADRLIYSTDDVRLTTAWAHGQDTAVVRVEQDGKNRLAAVTILRFPPAAEAHYRLVLGTLFDKSLLERLGRVSGLKTRLFYPRDGDFAKAFADEDRPLKLRLPPSGYAELQAKRDYFSAEAEGGAYFGLYSPVVDASGRVEAVLFSGLNRRTGAGWLTDQGVLTLAIVLLGSLFAGVTGVLLGRFVIRPVESLHQVVQRVAAQDFRATIPVRSDDELGELARAFNAMATSLRQARDEQQREFRRDKLTALGELSLAMAHEIRNPIGVITTALRLLETTKDTARAEQLRDMIREESRRIDQLLKDFQQLARHRAPELADIDPAEPLEKALQMLLAGRDDIRVDRHYAHGERRVPGDPELLRQLWMNLIRNALEAMGQGGGRLTVSSGLDGDCLILYLQDSGPGIALEQMPRLFEPFFTSKTQGSGLGLTIASTLAEANGASLELVPPEPGERRRGARFALRIACPAAQSSEE